MGSDPSQGSTGRDGNAAGVTDDFISAFARVCPDWALTFIGRTRPTVFARRQVVVVDAAISWAEKSRQVGLATDAVLHPDDAHPGVDVITGG